MVRSVNVGDEGLYECVAENSAGQVNAVARLSIVRGGRLPGRSQGTQCNTLAKFSFA